MAHNTMRHQALDDLMDPPNGWWRTGAEILQGMQLLFERKSSGGWGLSNMVIEETYWKVSPTKLLWLFHSLL